MKYFTIVYFLTLLLSTETGFTRPPISGERYELLSGVRVLKDRNIPSGKAGMSDDFSTSVPSWFLTDNFHYIPTAGKVLDIYFKEGQNAVFLARKGFRVTGLENNPDLIEKANLLMKEFEVKINIVQENAYKFSSGDTLYDAVIAFYFTDRALLKKIWNWIKPGGILILEGYTVLNRDTKEINSLSVEHFFKPGELMSLFKDYKILKYEEPLHLKVFTSSVIVQKR